MRLFERTSHFWGEKEINDDFFDCDEGINDRGFCLWIFPWMVQSAIIDWIFKSSVCSDFITLKARQKVIIPFGIGNFAHAFAETWEWNYEIEFNRWNYPGEL